jgi:hypothetical protein
VPPGTAFKRALCADIDEVSLHAVVRHSADDRPVLVKNRVRINASGQVALKLKTLWRG